MPTGARWRCPTADGWRTLRGDEVGVLLADHLMRRGVTGRYATTIVSSSLLRAMCAARGLPYAETLTGFKWIVRAGEDLVYGYEEALGYCVAPDVVRDKDGITAALRCASWPPDLAAEGRSLTDRLAELAAEFGVFATDQRVAAGAARRPSLAALMDRLRARPPAGAGRRAGHRGGGPAPAGGCAGVADRRPAAWWCARRAPSRSSRRTWRWWRPRKPSSEPRRTWRDCGSSYTGC